MGFQDEGFTGARVRYFIGNQQYCHVGIDSELQFGFIDDAPEMMCGSVDTPSERVQPGLRRARYFVDLKPTPDDIAGLLPLMGFNGTSYALTETLTEFESTLDFRSRTYELEKCKVDSWQIRSQRGQSWTLRLGVIGAVKEDDGSPPSSITDPNSGIPFAFHNSTLNLLSSARDYDRFVLSCENNLTERFQNSRDPDLLLEGLRRFRFGFSVPKITGNNDLIDAAVSGSTSTSGSLVLTSPSDAQTATLTLTLSAMFEPFQVPDVKNRNEEVRANHFYEIRRNSSGDAPIIATYAVA